MGRRQQHERLFGSRFDLCVSLCVADSHLHLLFREHVGIPDSRGFVLPHRHPSRLLSVVQVSAMTYMNEAYDCLIAKLKKELFETEKKMDDMYMQDNTAISMLLDFILADHGATITMKLAQRIENSGGKGIVAFVEDKIGELGLEDA